MGLISQWYVVCFQAIFTPAAPSVCVPFHAPQVTAIFNGLYGLQAYEVFSLAPEYPLSLHPGFGSCPSQGISVIKLEDGKSKQTIELCVGCRQRWGLHSPLDLMSVLSDPAPLRKPHDWPGFSPHTVGLPPSQPK